MNCEVCFNKFDSNSRKPLISIGCGHTLCLVCLENLKVPYCPFCRKYLHLSKTVPNYTVLNMLSTTQDTNLKFKQKIEKNLKEIEDSNRKYHHNYEKRYEESKEKISILKRKINKKTTDLMNKLLANQETLLDKLSQIESELNSKFEENFLLFEQKNEISEFKDLNKMDKEQLKSYKSELDIMKNDIDARTTSLDELKLTYYFQENEHVNFIDENLLGSLNEHNDVKQSPDRQIVKIIKSSPNLNNNYYQDQTQPEARVFSLNHEHPFEVVRETWTCDGAKIYGSCKSSKAGRIRYRLIIIRFK